MTAVINFTPLYGHDGGGALCSLLTIDKFRILLDCGWDESFNTQLLEPLKKIISEVDAVLISHPDIYHLGALPYAVGKLGLSAPIYTTLPVKTMGEMFMYETYMSIKDYDFRLFDLDDVDSAFNAMEKQHEPLKYSQDLSITDGITITPFAAGHMIGGTVWRITKETEEILYAVDYNHQRERHLNGTTLETFSRPTVLITDSYNALTNFPLRKDRDKQLFDCILETLRNKGKVLMPVDAAGRVLELLLLLHAQWDFAHLGGAYSLVLLSNQGFNTVEHAQKLIEWMSQAVMKYLDQYRTNPFDFKFLHVLHSKQELDMIKKPYVCLATNSTLSTSFAQEVFIDLATDPRNLILFTSRAPKQTLAYQLMQNPRPSSVTFARPRSILLEGKELKLFLEKQRMEREQKELEMQKELESDSESEPDVAQEEGREEIIQRRLKIKTVDLFPMYPYQEAKRQWDVWGESINPEDYKIPDRKEDVEMGEGDEQDMAEEKKEDIKPKIEDDRMTDAEAGEADIVKKTHESKGRSKEAIVQQQKVAEPRKVIWQQFTVDIKCGIKYIDFEGRSDGKSIKTILTHVAPRKLILFHGSAEATKTLKEYAERHICKEVYTPKPGQLVDITSETNIFRVTLKDALTENLRFVRVGEYELAYADGEIALNYKESPLPIVQPAPVDKVKGHPAVFLGDVKFSDLKLLLNQANIEAEFTKGTLVCANGAVNIRKLSKTEISIQGTLCQEYYRIRSILYGQYQFL